MTDILAAETAALQATELPARVMLADRTSQRESIGLVESRGRVDVLERFVVGVGVGLLERATVAVLTAPSGDVIAPGRPRKLVLLSTRWV